MIMAFEEEFNFFFVHCNTMNVEYWKNRDWYIWQPSQKKKKNSYCTWMSLHQAPACSHILSHMIYVSALVRMRVLLRVMKVLHVSHPPASTATSWRWGWWWCCSRSGLNPNNTHLSTLRASRGQCADFLLQGNMTTQHSHHCKLHELLQCWFIHDSVLNFPAFPICSGSFLFHAHLESAFFSPTQDVSSLFCISNPVISNWSFCNLNSPSPKHQRSIRTFGEKCFLTAMRVTPNSIVKNSKAKL